jgi:ubiquinone/menaquinone biosynthesis C-methylase UbiE
MDFDLISKMASSFSESRILQASLNLGIFDAIGEDSMTSSEVARALSLDIRATCVLLNALTAMELLEKREGRFSLTAPSRRYLLSGSPGYYGDMIKFDSSLWGIWGRLEESIRTGKPAKPPDMFQGDEEDTERFIGAMHSIVRARGDAEIITPMLGLETVQTVLDVGSGPGTYPMAFLRRHPHLRITIFDLPGTLKVTRRVLEKEGFLEKIALEEGDYNAQPLPSGFDLVFLSNIIHNEDENANRMLARNVYRSLNAGGRVVVKDHILDETLTAPRTGAVFSVQMLLMTRGRVYSFGEVARWLSEAGFSRVEHTPLSPPLTSSIVTAYK